MSNVKTRTLVTMVCWLLPALAAAQPWSDPGPGATTYPGQRLFAHVRTLTLSEAQRRDLDALEASHGPGLVQQGEEMARLRQAMVEARTAAEPQWERLNQLRQQLWEARGRLQQALGALRGKVLGLLTSEQQAPLWATRPARGAGRGRGNGSGPGAGRGQGRGWGGMGGGAGGGPGCGWWGASGAAE